MLISETPCDVELFGLIDEGPPGAPVLARTRDGSPSHRPMLALFRPGCDRSPLRLVKHSLASGAGSEVLAIDRPI